MTDTETARVRGGKQKVPEKVELSLIDELEIGDETLKKGLKNRWWPLLAGFR